MLVRPVAVTVTTRHGTVSFGTFTVNKLSTLNVGPALAAICQGTKSDPVRRNFGGAATSGTWSDGTIGGTFTPNANDVNATWTPPASYSGTATLTLTTAGGRM